MKSAFVAALGAAVLVALGASSGAQAAVIDFSFVAGGGTITYTGTSLDVSTALDLDGATLLVIEKGAGDASGLSLFDTVSLAAFAFPPSNIVYGSTPGPLGSNVTKSWTAGGDTFTETLTTVTSIDRKISNEIAVTLTGTLTDTSGLFMDSPVLLMLNANQDFGPGFPVVVTFTNTSSGAPAIPEASTWAMMALGFGALGYAASRRGKMRIATLFA